MKNKKIDINFMQIHTLCAALLQHSERFMRPLLRYLKIISIEKKLVYILSIFFGLNVLKLSMIFKVVKCKKILVT